MNLWIQFLLKIGNKINILENPDSCPKTPAPVTGFKFQNRPGSGSGQNFISGGTLVQTFADTTHGGSKSEKYSTSSVPSDIRLRHRKQDYPAIF
jgi:hypothetical protein